jgi:hypothetical protein
MEAQNMIEKSEESVTSRRKKAGEMVKCVEEEEGRRRKEEGGGGGGGGEVGTILITRTSILGYGEIKIISGTYYWKIEMYFKHEAK